jgi:hypothetical protein
MRDGETREGLKMRVNENIEGAWSVLLKTKARNSE